MTMSVVLEGDPDPVALPRTGWARPWGPVVTAAALFAALCALALSKGSQLLEPDDLAYRASITALLHGRLWLTNAQYLALSRQLSGTSAGGLGGIAQWVHRADGTWISEKNPGYPFYAVAFARLGLLRLAPLFYGAFAAVALYLGGRRWLGRWGGTVVVALFCTSGAAMVFAWRATMPSFTDASMVAAGCGLLLWAVLAGEHAARRRIVVGLAAFFAFDSAMFIRYTDVVAVLCASGTVAALWLLARSVLPRAAAATWLGSQVLFATFLASVNTYLYGHPFSTGYANGEITFSVGALHGNLDVMPRNLIVTMPMIVLAAAGVVWIAVRAAAGGRNNPDSTARRDLWVALALASVWIGTFGLYFFYDWTASMQADGPAGGIWGNVHLIRFYLPAIGPVALLGAWPLIRVPKAAALATVPALALLGVVSFGSMASAAVPGGSGPGCAPPGGIAAVPGGGGPSGQLPPGRLPSGQGPSAQLRPPSGPSGSAPAGAAPGVGGHGPAPRAGCGTAG